MYSINLAALPSGKPKLAREANFANNTMAAGYAELLNDLGVLILLFLSTQTKNSLFYENPVNFIYQFTRGFIIHPIESEA